MKSILQALKNVPPRRLGVFVLGAVLSVALYPVIIAPYYHPEEYREIQEVTRKGINREEIQPGGMRVWSDPFKDREKQEPQFLVKARQAKIASN